VALGDRSCVSLAKTASPAPHNVERHRRNPARRISGLGREERWRRNPFLPSEIEALADLPPGTVADGELVGLDDKGQPDFNLLQNSRGGAARIYYYIFDLLCCKDRDLTRLPLVERRALLKSLVTIRDPRIRISNYIEAGADEVLAAVREQQLEGIVGKRRDSRYEPGKRSGAWIKHRVTLGQEFVVGGYFPGPHGVDSFKEHPGES
jgi:bifunctional non-homologous end joining protein LigD